MKVKEYIALIQSYLDGHIAADEFAERYDKTFRSEPGGMPRALFDILQDLWEDVEAYSPMWTAEDEKKHFYKITERTLRREASEAVLQLRQYLRGHSE